jgi:ferric-dicitrate binding protein FerR (iron transport regulator)
MSALDDNPPDELKRRQEATDEAVRRERERRHTPSYADPRLEAEWQAYIARLDDPECRRQLGLEEARGEVRRKVVVGVLVAAVVVVVLTIVSLVAWHWQTQADRNACSAVNGQWLDGACDR